MSDFFLGDLVETNPGESWFDHPYQPFKILVSFLPPEERDGLTLKCKKTWKNPEKGYKTEEIFDTIKFNNLLADRVIKDWSGLTVAVLKQFFTGAKNQFGKLGEKALDCDPRNKEFLLKNSTDFQNWVLNLATDWEIFNRDKKEAELENLKI